MKKFVGLVNGKSFDNIEDWNKAALDAIEKDSDNLSISSYYSYVDDKEESEKIEDKKESNEVSSSEYILDEKVTPQSVKNDFVEYALDDKLQKRLENASNKEDIRKTVSTFVDRLSEKIDAGSDEIKVLEKDIDSLQKKLYEKIDDVKYNQGRKRYYNTILDIIGEPEKKEEYVKPDVSVKKVLGFDDDTSLLGILRQLGILR